MTLRDLFRRLEAAAADPQRQRVRLYVLRDELPSLLRSLRAAERRLMQEEDRERQAQAGAAGQLDWIHRIQQQQQQRQARRGRA